MKKTLQKLLALPLVTSLYLFLATPAAAQTQAWAGVCVEQYTDANGTAFDVATIQGLQCLIANIFLVAISLIGFAGFVMLIVGSFRYLLSGGNSKGTETARNTMTFAIVGLVVALSAFIIINLISSFTGVDLIRSFKIPDPDTGL